ncbi:MAG: DUF429 domain-containing protein [Actinomycetota bacterium]|nr:DUF429 domain-containing protein [Actinomycetota bacterium]
MSPAGRRVAGVDGCRGGWLVVTADADPDPERTGRPATVEVVADIGDVVGRVRTGELAIVGVDMPIGLTDRGPRPCDRAARRALGPRRSSVFPAPIRPLLGIDDYETALATARRLDDGRGLSRQSFNLLGAIEALDRAVRAPGVDAERVVEVCPELSFALLAGHPLAEPKRTAAGRADRRRLLVEHVAGIDEVLDGPTPRGAATDDVLDACAVVWTARRVVAGVAQRFTGTDDTGTDAVDALGLAMVVRA